MVIRWPACWIAILWQTRTAPTARAMKSVIIIFCCCLGSSSAWAIDCLSAPGDPKTGWYSWREIDGRKCWFQKTGAMPPKSQLFWPAKVRQDVRPIEPASPLKERTAPVVVTAKAETATVPEPKLPTPPRFKTVRVKPAMDVSLRLGNGLDLMNGASLTTMRAVGGTRQKSGSVAPDEPFAARFNGQQ